MLTNFSYMSLLNVYARYMVNIYLFKKELVSKRKQKILSNKEALYSLSSRIFFLSVTWNSSVAYI